MGKMSGDKYPEDKRLVFDTITEQFDEWRERYSEELFEYIRTTCELKAGKKMSGDRTRNRTGIRFLRFSPAAIIRQLSLEKIWLKQCKKKYGSYKNFKMVHDDFETHLFAPDYF